MYTYHLLIVLTPTFPSTSLVLISFSIPFLGIDLLSLLGSFPTTGKPPSPFTCHSTDLTDPLTSPNYRQDKKSHLVSTRRNTLILNILTRHIFIPSHRVSPSMSILSIILLSVSNFTSETKVLLFPLDTFPVLGHCTSLLYSQPQPVLLPLNISRVGSLHLTSPFLTLTPGLQLLVPSR